MNLNSLPERAVYDLETGLGDLTVLDVSVGSLLGRAWHAELCTRSNDVRPSARLRDVAVSLVRQFPRRTVDATADLEPGRILGTWINIRHHCRELVVPLVESVGAQHWNILGRDAEMEALLPSGCGFFTWSGLPNVPRSSWWSAYQRIRREVRTRTLDQLGAYPGYAQLWTRLENSLLVQVHLVAVYHQLLARLKPRLVITEWDRQPRVAPLMGVARARQIPTLTQVHGVVNNDFGYTPVLADSALCWGEQQRDQLIGYGVAPDRLAVTGYPRLTRELQADPISALQKAGFDLERPLVLLASNPIRPELRLSFAQQYCEAMAPLTSVQAAVRLHPSERLDFYADLQRRFPTIRFMANDEWTLDEALAAAQLVVCHDSGLGNDALVKGRLAVVFDVLPVPLGNGKTLIEKAGCPRAVTAEELRFLVDGIITDVAVSAPLRERAEAYIGYFCAAFGVDATRNAAKLVQERARLSS